MLFFVLNSDSDYRHFSLVLMWNKNPISTVRMIISIRI